ncbi:hypothetical protein GQ44DRAFT_625908 [Phaeosphaeriaceae sp. PMI808]|nr:hypothetical protein GQ44DRAFT_625908 [Phaeosphaeriaceae sp. PMI808]
MVLFGRISSSKFLIFYTFLAVCAIILCYEIWTLKTTHSIVAVAQNALHPVPVQETSRIPKKLWYKLGPAGLTDDTRNWTNTCIQANPEYHAEFMTDGNDDEWVRTTFASRPDIVDTYLRLTVPIFKADILRYLLLFDQGGIWSDLDVSCEGVPIDEWVPAEYKDKAGLVVGWEFDIGWPGEYTRQFTSWLIMASPKSPHMMQVIDDLIEVLHKRLEEMGVPIEGATMDIMGDVVDFSGPRRLTRSVYKSLGKQLNRIIGAKDMQEIYQPKLVGDVLVMPGRSFAASVNTYESEDEAWLPPKLVAHHYAGTWKNDHGGE